MIATKIQLEDFRNLRAAEVALSPGVNVLAGDNAQGKSNILESIYYFARGKSFRGVPDRLLVRSGADFGRATLSCRRADDRYDTVLSVTVPAAGRRRLTRDGATLSGVREMIGSFRAVLFCPEHLTLVSGAPAIRRTFLDAAIAQLSPAYVSALTTYTRALAERSALLRQAQESGHTPLAQLDVYADVMAKAGAVVYRARRRYTDRLSEHVAASFAAMTDGREKPCLTYESDAIPAAEDPAAALRAALTRDIPREIRAGTTLSGVHRDDIRLTLNGEDAKLYASQGQTRSFALAMKLGEGAISRDAGGEEPVYLLDDVFSELDAERRRYLLSALGERQVIITSCEPDERLLRLPEVAVFTVRAGEVKETPGGTPGDTPKDLF